MHSRHTLARAALALALSTPPVVAQDCVDDYIETRSGTNHLTGCALASSPCSFPTPEFPTLDADVYRVQGGGTNLQDKIFDLIFTATRFTIIDVGPDSLPIVQEIYDPILIEADNFPFGLAIIARWGPTWTIIDGTSIGGIPGSGPATQCVTIQGAGFPGVPIRIGAAANRLVLNDPILPDYSGWYGFEIRNGFALFGTDGGGVRVANLSNDLDLAGNAIHDNQGRNTGGGVLLIDPSNAYVALNHVFENRLAVDCEYAGSPVQGAGIHQLVGNLQLLGNHIERNGFGETCRLTPEPARQGGGVAVLLGTKEATTHFACGNKVLENSAAEGNGYWIDATAFADDTSVRLELNEIRANESWEPTIPPGSVVTIDGAFRGGGVAIRGLSALPKGQPTPTLELEILANRIADNTVLNPGLIVTPPVLLDAPDDVGGGIWSYVERDANDVVAIVGNAIWGNSAPDEGGGVWLRHPSTPTPPDSGELHHNTIAWNEVTTANSVGGGIYLTADTSFVGSGLVIWGNEVAGTWPVRDGDWYGEPGVSGEFTYSQMSFLTAASASLIGVGSDPADPLLVADDWHLTGDPSPCVDSGELGLGLLLDLLFGLDVDADGGPREVDRVAVSWPGLGVIDRGADEFLSFMRGDVNADGAVDIADAIELLNSLFVPPGVVLQCPAAADANVDGLVNIADPVQILCYIFGTCAVPPPPSLGVCVVVDAPDPPGTPSTGIGTPCIP